MGICQDSTGMRRTDIANKNAQWPFDAHDDATRDAQNFSPLWCLQHLRTWHEEQHRIRLCQHAGSAASTLFLHLFAGHKKIRRGGGAHPESAFTVP